MGEIWQLGKLFFCKAIAKIQKQEHSFLLKSFFPSFFATVSSFLCRFWIPFKSNWWIMFILEKDKLFSKYMLPSKHNGSCLLVCLFVWSHQSECLSVLGESEIIMLGTESLSRARKTSSTMYRRARAPKNIRTGLSMLQLQCKFNLHSFLFWCHLCEPIVIFRHILADLPFISHWSYFRLHCCCSFMLPCFLFLVACIWL